MPSVNSSEQMSHGTGAGASYASGESTSQGESTQQSSGKTSTFSEGHSTSTSKSKQKSVTYKKVTIPRHEIRDVPTGQPVISIEQQNYRVIQQLNCLNQGEAFVRTKFEGQELSFKIKVLEVEEPYSNWGEYFSAINDMKTLLIKPYHRVPDSSDNTQNLFQNYELVSRVDEEHDFN